MYSTKPPGLSENVETWKTESRRSDLRTLRVTGTIDKDTLLSLRNTNAIVVKTEERNMSRFCSPHPLKPIPLMDLDLAFTYKLISNLLGK
jgi:hypothetical protein